MQNELCAEKCNYIITRYEILSSDFFYKVFLILQIYLKYQNTFKLHVNNYLKYFSKSQKEAKK